MANNNEGDGAAGLIAGLVVASIFWLFIIGLTDDWQRKGNFYVTSERQGWVVRMDNGNGNATNISKPLPSVEAATKLANNLNRDLNGNENNQ